MSALASSTTERLRRRATAFALLARLLGRDVDALLDESTIETLDAVLADPDDVRPRRRLAEHDATRLPDAATLAGRWVRWFDSGRVAAYEGSNVPATAAGITPRLADVAGFYAAFGCVVRNDRPDHIVAELEFMSVLLVAEADARDAGRDDQAEVTAGAARVFLRDHLGTWVTAWASRVGEIDDLRPWFPVAAAAAELVACECHDRRVIPVRLSPVLPADLGIDPPDATILECGE